MPMKTILVIFHSQQYGNTKILAEAQAGETLSSGRPISEEAKKNCRALGKKLVESLK